MHHRRAHGCHNGEYDGRRATQTGPTHQQLLAKRRTKRRKQQRHHCRAGHKGQKQGNQQRPGRNVRQLGRKCQQPQQEEQYHLHQRRGSVKKVYQPGLVGDSAVAQNHTGQIYAEIAVTAQHFRQHIGQQRHRHGKHRIKPGREAKATQHPSSTQWQHHAKQHTIANLCRQHGRELTAAAATVHHRQYNGGEHIRKRIVAAALHL